MKAEVEPSGDAGGGAPAPPRQVVMCETETELDTRALQRRASELFDALGEPEAIVSIVLVDDTRIRGLNVEYREIDAPTDVLSFSMRDGEDMLPPTDMLGDIVISVETAARMVSRAEHRDRVAEELDVAGIRLGWSLLDEVTFLMIHGALHLLGHDHATTSEAAAMRAREAELMRRWLADTNP